MRKPKLKTVGDLRAYIAQINDDTLLSEIQLKQIRPRKYDITITLRGLELAAIDEQDAEEEVRNMIDRSQLKDMIESYEFESVDFSDEDIDIDD